MTEHQDDGGRAERAFRDALARRAGAHEPVSLDPAAAARAARRRSRWVAGAAAAAVLVVATAATAVTALSRDGDSAGDGPPAASKPSATAAGFDGPTRQVSWRGVVADVPVSWPDESGPGADWCASADGRGGSLFPTRPYVARDRTHAVTLTIGCLEANPAPAEFGDAPETYWAPHLSFAPAVGNLPDGTSTYRGWSLTTRTVGDVRVSLLTDASTAGLVEPIIDSVHTAETDANGCDGTSPVQAKEFVRPEQAFDVTAVDEVDSISVCQYDRATGTSSPGLLGSRLIEGQAAQDLLDAIKRAPAGGGPDAPQHCVHDMYGDTALAVRLHTGDQTRDMHVYYEWCFGNGLDDGTTRRELTRDDCLPLWGGRVTHWGGSTESFSRCHAEP